MPVHILGMKSGILSLSFQHFLLFFMLGYFGLWHGKRFNYFLQLLLDIPETAQWLNLKISSFQEQHLSQQFFKKNHQGVIFPFIYMLNLLLPLDIVWCYKEGRTFPRPYCKKPHIQFQKEVFIVYSNSVCYKLN